MTLVLVLVLLFFSCISILGVFFVYARTGDDVIENSSSSGKGGSNDGDGGGGSVSAVGLTPVPAGKDLELTANGITIVFAKRLAGAVWNLRWKGHEFVGETMGNGGSMQSALTYDVMVGQSSEEENPTEAGSSQDYGGKTTSKWTEAAKSANEVFTKCQMAYYYPPGEIVASSASKARARGKGPVSDTTISKRVSIGYRGFPNVINYSIKFECPGKHWFVQHEVLTDYMPRTFNKIYTVQDGKAVAQGGNMYMSSPPNIAVPVIIAKNDSTAMGVYTHTSPPNPTYKAPTSPWYTVDAKTQSGHLPWDNGQNPAGIVAPFTKWSVVWHGGSQLKKTERIAATHIFGIALVIGSVAECASVIGKLQRGE